MRLIHAVDGGTGEHVIVLTTNDTDDAVTILERDTYHHASNVWAIIDDLHLTINIPHQGNRFEWPVDRGLPVDLPLIPDLQ